MAFSSTRLIAVSARDLRPVARDLMDHFRTKGFEVSVTPTDTGGQKVSLSKGDLFKTALGLRSALNVTMEPAPGGTLVTARVGLFETQAVATVVTRFVFPPLLLAQIWGLAQQSKLDEEAIDTVERNLTTRFGSNPRPTSGPVPRSGSRSCARCGQTLAPGVKFCSECGSKVA